MVLWFNYHLNCFLFLVHICRSGSRTATLLGLIRNKFTAWSYVKNGFTELSGRLGLLLLVYFPFDFLPLLCCLCLKQILIETELSKMSWNSNIEVHCMNNSYPYSTASFMEYFEGLTYDHVNFIFSGASHSQVPSLWFWMPSMDLLSVN